MLISSINALGLASWQDVKFYTGSTIYREHWKSTKQIQEFLNSQVESGSLERVSIHGIQDTYYVTATGAKNLENLKANTKKERMKFLCPFDNLIRERHLPSKLWSFDYKIEAYTPPQERKYGYYVLPILHGNEFVGRMDAKVHRQKNLLEVKSLFTESDQWSDDETLNAFKMGLDHFANFHNCNKIQIGTVNPKRMTARIRSLFE